jgi:hypothetical protein
MSLEETKNNAESWPFVTARDTRCAPASVKAITACGWGKYIDK